MSKSLSTSYLPSSGILLIYSVIAACSRLATQPGVKRSNSTRLLAAVPVTLVVQALRLRAVIKRVVR